ncbi:MAG: Gfo/Idh/MocA family oxidoreductase [Clostridia bacterium]|nr:Gfo/Idh/MocA family oxidoreductase [Clostridia bacterium]MBN2883185.1 Gfo/Idh/MocA family oxidoreductase [Clostridia bacterium]
MEKTRVGVVGCGAISGIYLKNMTGVFDNIEVKAICDLDAERTEKAAREYGIKNIYTLEEMLADDEISIIVNLTTPKSHYSICKKAILAGKHVHVEKPLCVELEEGVEMVELAESKGLYIGSAPDTFLGAGIQTCIGLINDGKIGRPVSATAFMMCHGHESWHPDPEFYYEKGGGPMFDMGPYYLTALVNLLGPVKKVAGMTGTAFEERTITSKKKNGKKVKVEVPTHVNGLMEFESGAIGNIITSFDVWGHNMPRIEIHGTEGSLSVPDPNSFAGPVYLKTMDMKEFVEIPVTLPYSENSRGIGVSEMADAISSGRKNKASGRIALHVLELMHGFHIAAASGKNYETRYNCIY